MAKSRGTTSTDLTNFTILHNEFIDSQVLDGYEKLVFIAIKRHLNNQSFQAFPSVKTICKHTGLSKPTVIKAVKSLEEKHILTVEHRNSEERGHMSNLYTLMDYKEMWTVSSKEDMKMVAKSKKFEWAKQIIESAGGTVIKKEPESEPTKAQNQALELNQYDIVNTTTNYDESQLERYTIDQIRQIYDYDYLIKDEYISEQDVETVMNILYDALNTRKSSIRINGEDKPTMVVISKLMKLEMKDIKYSIGKYHEHTERINNVKAYLLTILYNSKEQGYLDLMNQGHTNGDF